MEQSLDKYNFGLSFGTYLLREKACRGSIMTAITCGYRSIDTAELYRNHEDVSIGLSSAYEINFITRDDIFITSKIHNKHQKKMTIAESISKIKKELNLEASYIDCILLHSPVFDVNKKEKYVEAWKELCENQTFFNIINIGVSNFGAVHIDKIVKETNICPFLNQIELHPRNYNHQLSTIEYCKKNDIIIQSHSPIKPFLDSDNLSVPIESIVNWYYDKNIATIIKSANPDRIAYNMQCYLNAKKTSSQCDSLKAIDDDFFIFKNFKF